MSGPFDISTATTTVSLDKQRQATVTVTVKNSTRRNITGIAHPIATPETATEWVTIEKPTRDFSIEATHQFQIQINVPDHAEAGNVTFHLVVADEFNPGDNYSAGPDMMFTIPEIPKPSPSKFPLWLIPVVLVVIVAIVGILVLASRPSDPQASVKIAGIPIYSDPYSGAPIELTTEANVNYPIIGLYEESGWYQVDLLDNETGWIEGDADDVEISGNLNDLPVLPALTPTATATPEPMLTPTPGLPKVTARRDNVTVYRGPSTQFPSLESLDEGDTLDIIGRDSNEAWFQIDLPGGQVGWVQDASSQIRTSGDMDSVSVIEDYLLPALVSVRRVLNVSCGTVIEGTVLAGVANPGERVQVTRGGQTQAESVVTYLYNCPATPPPFSTPLVYNPGFFGAIAQGATEFTYQATLAVDNIRLIDAIAIDTLYFATPGASLGTEVNVVLEGVASSLISAGDFLVILPSN